MPSAPAKTQTKQTAPIKKEEPKPAHTGPVQTLKVMSNVACNFYVDGEYTATLTETGIERINLKMGEYQLKAVSTDNSADVYLQIYKVDKTGIEKFHEIDLKTIAAERQSREGTEQSNAQKDAAEKAAIAKANADKAAREKATAQQAAADKTAREKTERDYENREKTQAEKLAAEQAAAEKASRQKAEAERIEAEKAAQEKINREKAQEERRRAEAAAEELARQKAEAQRIAAERVEEQRRIAAAEEEKRRAAEAQRLAAENAAREKAEAEARRIAEAKAAEFSLYGFTVYDDFSDNKSGWTEENWDKHITRITDGKLIIESLADGISYRNVVNFPANTEKDFTMEGTVRWISGDNNNGFGIDFASNIEGNAYYSFQIAAIGYFSVLSRENGTWQEIIKWTENKNINRNSEINKLKIKKEDDYLYFYVNGELVEKIPWTGGFGTDFGFRVFDKQLVEFDDFQLKGIKN